MQKQRVLAVRIPKLTYDKLIDASISEQISVSGFIRNVLIGFLESEDEDLNKIRSYKAKKRENIYGDYESR